MNSFEEGSFVLPGSVEILGSKGEEGFINEADVLFSDHEGHNWYLTIQTANDYVRDVVADFTGKDLSDLVVLNEFQTTGEPEKMVWNEQLNEQRIIDILQNAHYDLLKPYVVMVDDIE